MTMYAIEIGYEGCSERGCCVTSTGFLFEANSLEEAEARAEKAEAYFGDDGYIIRVEEADEWDLKTYEVRQ